MSQSLSESPSGEIDRELTTFQHAILVVLSEDARYGLAIKRELEDYYNSAVNHGRLYPNLDDLVAMGLVEKSELDKRTNEYALTEAGHDAIVDRLAWVCSRVITTESRAQTVRDLVGDAQP